MINSRPHFALDMAMYLDRLALHLATKDEGKEAESHIYLTAACRCTDRILFHLPLC